MKQDMILILDLGSEENPKIAREIRALGVYTEIHPHDITAEELAKLPGVKGIILNGGVNRVVDGVEIDASEAVYNAGLPILKADHKGGAAFPADDAERETVLKHFVFDTCKAEANWNMENFIADQIELIKRQVGHRWRNCAGSWSCRPSRPRGRIPHTGTHRAFFLCLSHFSACGLGECGAKSLNFLIRLVRVQVDDLHFLIFRVRDQCSFIVSCFDAIFPKDGCV